MSRVPARAACGLISGKVAQPKNISPHTHNNQLEHARDVITACVANEVWQACAGTDTIQGRVHKCSHALTLRHHTRMNASMNEHNISAHAHPSKNKWRHIATTGMDDVARTC